MKKYLFIGAHTDDCELLFGATIAQAVERGHDVTILCLSKNYHNVGNLSREFYDSMAVLEPTDWILKNFKVREFDTQRQQILQLLCDLSLNKYDYVFTHSPKDIHNDHKVVGEESIRAFKTTNLLTSMGEWNQRQQVKNYFVKVEEKHFIKKWRALSKYKSQSKRPYIDYDKIRAIMLVNGLIIGNTDYAEAFESINLIQ